MNVRFGRESESSEASERVMVGWRGCGAERGSFKCGDEEYVV